MKKHYSFFAMNLLILMFLISCSAKAQESSPREMSKVFAEAGLRLLSQKVSPREFSLPIASPGATVETQSLSALKGKMVFLNFWATWCGPCRIEMPSMENLYNRYRDKGFEIIAVNARESQEEVLSFMKDNGFSFPVLLDADGKVNGAYGIQAIPTTFLIDREGNIVLRLVGSIDWDTPKIHAAIESLLN